MKELIKITENNGRQAVSARELYNFLEIKRDFTSWCKQMVEYGFEQDKDFTPILGKSSGGRPSVDYALTIDTAKHWSMMQRNERGMQARQYFIEVEKRANGTINSELDLIIRSANILREQELRLSKVEEKVDRLIGVHEEAERDLYELPISDEEIPEMSLRDQIRMLVNKYCKVSNLGQHQVWDKVYTTLYYSYHIPLRSYKMRKGESLLDVAERVGCLDKIHVIVSGLFKRLNFIEF